MALPLVFASYRMYEMKTLTVDTPRGRIITRDDEMSQAFWGVVDYINKAAPANARVVCIPEGMGVNYFTGRKNPLKYYDFHPPDVNLLGEDKYIEELRNARVEYIIHFELIELDDYGSRGFGVDYGNKINEWIKANYRPVMTYKNYLIIYRPNDG
jgi:hypothetical protein